MSRGDGEELERVAARERRAEGGAGADADQRGGRDGAGDGRHRVLAHREEIAELNKLRAVEARRNRK